MPREPMFTFNLISQNVDGDKLYNVFSILYKTIFLQRATIDDKLKHILNKGKMIIQSGHQNV